MAEQEVTEFMNQLEAELSSGQAGSIVPDLTSLTIPRPDIPALREKLAVLVSTGKAKEAIGVQLTHEQVKRLSEKDVEKYIKRFETYVGSKTTETVIESYIFLVTKAVGMVVDIKDIDAYQKELRNDYVINQELSNLAGNLALNCGRFLAVANAMFITTKHIDFNSHLERKDKAKLEEIPEHYSPTAEQFLLLNIPFVSKCLPNNPRAHIRRVRSRQHIRRSRSHSKQQLQLQLQPRSAQKTPSVWLMANWLLKERGWPANNRKKPQLRPLS